MKKLMVLLGVCALASASQAAKFDWNYWDGTGLNEDANVYVMLGDTAKTDWTSVDQIKGDAAFLGSAKIEDQAGDLMADGTGYGIDATGGNVYYVLVNADETKFAVSSVAEVSSDYIYDGQQTSPGIFYDIDSDSMGEFQTFGVPEPTSGLLLLLGVAGLALRRRRA